MLPPRKQRGKPVRIRHGRATVMDEPAARVTGDKNPGKTQLAMTLSQETCLFRE